MQPEQLTSELLLNQGVKVKFKRLGSKNEQELVLRSPTMRTLLEIAHLYLQINTDLDKELSSIEAFELLEKNGEMIAKIVAVAILNGKDQHLLDDMAKQLLSEQTPKDLFFLYQLIIVKGGIEDFINTIRFIGATRITKPMNLSHTNKTS